MIRLSVPLTFCIALCTVGPTSHAERSQFYGMSVDSFSPKEGAPGTAVTIRGKGFTERVRVFIGGRRVKPSSQTSEELVVEVPRKPKNGRIVLRKPGRGEVLVGEFSLDLRPVVRSIAPTSGVPGTRVEIRGQRLKQAVPSISGKDMRILERSARRLLAVIPEGAATGPILVARPGGPSAKNPVNFRVTVAVPRLRRMRPNGGPPGQRVRLFGKALAADAKVYYGDTLLTPTERGPDWVDVAVPRTAKTAEFFTIRTAGGETRTRRAFALERLPVIAKLSTQHVVPGASVVLTGENFQRHHTVEIGEQAARILKLRANSMTVVVPRGVKSGRLEIIHGDRRIAAPTPLTVGYKPVIETWGPRRGPAGTVIRIAGRYLDGAKVFYGKTPMALEAAPAGELRVRVPEGANSQRITVRSPFGDVPLKRVFRFLPWAVVTDVQPRTAQVGTLLTISGNKLQTIDRFYIGDHPLKVVSRGPLRIQLRVGQGARSGVLSWQNHGVRRDKQWRITVRYAPPPIIRSTSGTVDSGSEIIVRGRLLGKDMVATWGPHRLKVTYVDARGEQARIAVPDDLVGSEYLTLSRGPESAKSKRPVGIRPPARRGPKRRPRFKR